MSDENHNNLSLKCENCIAEMFNIQALFIKINVFHLIECIE